MISQTRLAPRKLMSKIGKAIKSMKDKMKHREQGDVKADEDILDLIMLADDRMKKLIYSFLFMLENEGKLNAGNIPALKEIEKMDDNIRKHARQDVKEEDYLRRLAAHFEALTELKMKEAAKMAKHIKLANKYDELAKAHEEISQAYQNR